MTNCTVTARPSSQRVSRVALDHQPEGLELVRSETASAMRWPLAQFPNYQPSMMSLDHLVSAANRGRCQIARCAQAMKQDPSPSRSSCQASDTIGEGRWTFCYTPSIAPPSPTLTAGFVTAPQEPGPWHAAILTCGQWVADPLTDLR